MTPPLDRHPDAFASHTLSLWHIAATARHARREAFRAGFIAGAGTVIAGTMIVVALLALARLGTP